MSLTPVQNQPSTLAGAGNSLADTTLVLTSLLAIDGSTHLTMASFGTKGYATLEPGNGTQEEQISFTGITNNANGTDTLTGVSTVLFVTPYTETSGLAKTHPGGSQFVISNTAGFYNHFAVLDDSETITGTWTFTTVPVSATDPTISTQIANKHYVDGVAVSGAPNATTAVKGIVQEATQAQTDAKTVTGSTGADLYLNPGTQRTTLLSDYVADTGAANAYVITPSPVISAYAIGQRFTFKAASANTAASTLNVNGLGTKSITKLYNTALVANDIIANQIVEVEYDGTQFQIMMPSGRDFVDTSTNQTVGGVKTFNGAASQFSALPQSSAVPGTGNDLVNKTYVDANPVVPKNGTTTYDVSTASGTTTIAHGLGRVPKMARITAMLNQTTGGTVPASSISIGLYNGTTNTVLESFLLGAGGNFTQSLMYTSSSIGVSIHALTNADNNKATAVITVDATNITLTWTKTGAPTGTANLMWEVN